MAGTQSHVKSSSVSLESSAADNSGAVPKSNGSIPVVDKLTNGSSKNPDISSSASSSPSPVPSQNGKSQTGNVFDLGFELTELYGLALKFYKGWYQINQQIYLRMYCSTFAAQTTR